MIIDVWMQHPTTRHSAHECSTRFATGRKTPPPPVITPEMTIDAMDRGGVSIGLAAAWCAPEGWMISNDGVAAMAQAYPGPGVAH
jgi:uncharacterized protein